MNWTSVWLTVAFYLLTFILGILATLLYEWRKARVVISKLKVVIVSHARTGPYIEFILEGLILNKSTISKSVRNMALECAGHFFDVSENDSKSSSSSVEILEVISKKDLPLKYSWRYFTGNQHSLNELKGNPWYFKCEIGVRKVRVKIKTPEVVHALLRQ